MNSQVKIVTPHLDRFDIFPWNKNFETGIDIVDEQHKRLVELLNKLAENLVLGTPHMLTSIFDELAAYAGYHFENEAVLWARCFGDDPWLVSHQEAHNSFLPKVLELREEHSDKPLIEMTEHIVKFLIRWLALHIIDSDKRMAFVLHNIEAGASLKDAKKKSDEEMRGSTRILIEAVLNMYESISSRTLELMREIVRRKDAEEKLKEANCKLEDLSITDQLTGLYNRRHFNAVFERELRRAKREKLVLSFLMFDIDYFKKLNDHYGHFEGDLALKKVSQKVKELCRRPVDYVFRIGGEEFGVLVADQSSQVGEKLAEKICIAIADLCIPNVKSDVADHLTISIGMVAKVPTSTDTMVSYMGHSDDRLYRAKGQGRNQVVSSD